MLGICTYLAIFMVACHLIILFPASLGVFTTLAKLFSVQCYSRLHHITLAPLSLRPRLARLWTLVTSGPLSLAPAAARPALGGSGERLAKTLSEFLLGSYLNPPLPLS